MGVRDLEIARSVTLKPIQEIGEALGLGADDLEPYGRLKAKVRWEAVARAAKGSDGALVLVTAMTPTPAGEGKSTTTVGLGDALNEIERDGRFPLVPADVRRLPALVDVLPVLARLHTITPRWASRSRLLAPGAPADTRDSPSRP